MSIYGRLEQSVVKVKIIIEPSNPMLFGARVQTLYFQLTKRELFEPIFLRAIPRP